MTVVVRADSSNAIGSGHVVRCLTLADALRARGERVVFVCRRLPGAILDAPRSAGFPVLELGEPDGAAEPDPVAHSSWLGTTQAADAAQTLTALETVGISPTWFVVDSYALDARWENAVRKSVGRIAVIDDLADRPHDADVVVDTGCGEGQTAAYERLVPSSCSLLLGPAHAFLRREFGRALVDARVRERMERILVFFGGVDATDETAKALEGLVAATAGTNAFIDVVWGAAYPHASRTRAQFGALPRVNLLGSTTEMAQLMIRADLAVGGAGTSTWERCYLGLPCVTSALAGNQEPLASCVAGRGAAVYLGRSDETTATEYERAVRKFAIAPGLLAEMSRAASEVTSGAHVARHHHLVNLMLAAGEPAPQYSLRPLREDDLGLVRAWRNAPEVRDRMTTRHEIGAAEHRNWFDGLADDSSIQAYVFESNGVPAGFFQLTGIDRKRGDCEWGFYIAPGQGMAGLGSAMCFLGAESAFDDFGLNRVFGGVNRGNAASLRLHERFGFLSTGAREPKSAGASMLVLERETWERVRTAIASRVFEGDDA